MSASEGLAIDPKCGFDRGNPFVERTGKKADFFKLLIGKGQPGTHVVVEVRFLHHVDGNMQEGAGGSDQDALRPKRLDATFDQGKGTVEFRTPDIATVYYAKGKRERCWDLWKHLLQLCGGTNQVQVECGDREAQDGRQILAQVSKIGGEQDAWAARYVASRSYVAR